MPDLTASIEPAGTPATGARMAAFAADHWLLLLGLAALILPTLASVAHDSWSTEQGAHGPVVLATGIWLVLRMRPIFVPLIQPGSPALAAIGLAVTLILYALGRISGTLEMEIITGMRQAGSVHLRSTPTARQSGDEIVASACID